MGLPAEKHRYSILEYLSREREALEKHEYRDGEILMMAGGTGNHSLIVANTIRSIGNRLEGKPCHVYDSNLRIRIPKSILYTYPDVIVICGPRETDANDANGETFTNPRLLVEVLSPSSEAYDRGEKFSRYRLLDSLAEYVLVSQDTHRVETYFRQPEGTWLLNPISGLQSMARLRSLDIELPLREVYAGIELPPSGMSGGGTNITE